MKNLYDKNKGKVYPSPSSSSGHSSCSPNRDALSVLNLLPAAILALASVLSLEDREVLAYMITWSMKIANPSSILMEEKKKCKKSNKTHKSPIFSCGCFDCYTCYWFRWDSSPNGELIHQAIEAFEEQYLTNSELSSKSSSSCCKGKKKDKMGRRGIEKPSEKEPTQKLPPPVSPDSLEKSFLTVPGNEGTQPVGVAGGTGGVTENPEVCQGREVEGVAGEVAAEMEVFRLPARTHRSMVRKSWPDVLGLFHSRLWSLWGPNI